MREVIGNGWERRSGQKRELRANERSPKTGNRPKMGKLQNQVEKSDFAIFLLKKRCCYDQVVMQQDSTLSTTSIVFWWILFTLCTEISSQIVVEWIIVQLIWLFVVDNFLKLYFFSLPQQGQISWGHLFNPYPPHISALKCLYVVKMFPDSNVRVDIVGQLWNVWIPLVDFKHSKLIQTMFAPNSFKLFQDKLQHVN